MNNPALEIGADALRFLDIVVDAKHWKKPLRCVHATKDHLETSDGHRLHYIENLSGKIGLYTIPKKIEKNFFNYLPAWPGENSTDDNYPDTAPSHKQFYPHRAYFDYTYLETGALRDMTNGKSGRFAFQFVGNRQPHNIRSLLRFTEGCLAFRGLNEAFDRTSFAAPWIDLQFVIDILESIPSVTKHKTQTISVQWIDDLSAIKITSCEEKVSDIKLRNAIIMPLNLRNI